MWKYTAVAVAARAFSVNSLSRRAYRSLGNVVLSRMRVADGLPDRYLDRARKLLRVCEDQRILHPGDRVLELGTGWVHWEAVIVRLFHDVDVTLYDVCDNRLFSALKVYLEQLDGHLDELGAAAGIGSARVREAHRRLDAARAAVSFDELYDVLHFRYVLDPAGTLDRLSDRDYALVVSADTLEHVDRESLPTYLATLRDLLCAGGYSYHQIDLVDHFHYFDTSCSPKHFYRYDDARWRRLWDSDVQYVNRVQRPEWRSLFTGAGFELVREDRVSEAMGEIPRAGAFRELSQEDVDCLQTIPLHRRPVAVAVPAQRPVTDEARAPLS